MTLTHAIIKDKLDSGEFSGEKLHRMMHDSQWLTKRKYGNTSNMELLPVHIEIFKDEEGEDYVDAAFKGRFPVANIEKVSRCIKTGDLFVIEIDKWDGADWAWIVKTPRQIENYLKVRK